MKRTRLLVVLWLTLAPLLLLVWYREPTTNRHRAAFALCLALFLLGGLLFAWPRKVTRYLVLGFYALCMLFLVSPFSPAPDPVKLRAAYCRELLSYRGCAYVWGGEGRFGVDCSGLMRRGLIDAAGKEGLCRLNPQLARTALWLWWHDGSAATMGDGYAGRTRPIATAPALNQLDHATIRPGDLAVTKSGLHVLAYLGNRQWISADPVKQRVIVNDAADASNGYLQVPVKIVRWTLLDSRAPGPGK